MIPIFSTVRSQTETLGTCRWNHMDGCPKKDYYPYSYTTSSQAGMENIYNEMRNRIRNEEENNCVEVKNYDCEVLHEGVWWLEVWQEGWWLEIWHRRGMMTGRMAQKGYDHWKYGKNDDDWKYYTKGNDGWKDDDDWKYYTKGQWWLEVWQEGWWLEVHYTKENDDWKRDKKQWLGRWCGSRSR